jgi:hypothetical protein
MRDRNGVMARAIQITVLIQRSHCISFQGVPTLSSSKVSTRGGSLLDRFGTMIYRAWFGYRDRTGVFRRSDLAEGVAASRFQSHRIYLRTIWREVCNVRHRIALLHKNKLHRYGICLETALERHRRTHHQQYNYRQARMRSIRTLLTIHPGATLVDLHLLLQTIGPHLFEEDRQMATGIASPLHPLESEKCDCYNQ